MRNITGEIMLKPYTDTEEKVIKETMLGMQRVIIESIDIIEKVSISLEGEKLWDYSTELTKAKQKLESLLM
jgi:hypothetical protein